MPTPCGVGSVQSLQDNFDDGTTNSGLWAVDCLVGTLQEVDGYLFMAPSEAVISTCSYTSITSKSLIGCQATVKVLQVLSENVVGNTFFSLAGAPTGALTNAVVLYVDQGNLYPIHIIKGAISNVCPPVEYDPSKHVYWRLSEAGGQLTYSTSKDAKSWDPICIILAPPFLNSVKLSIGTNVASVGIQTGAARFDDVNILP